MDQGLDLLALSFVAHLAGISQPLDGREFKEVGMLFYSTFSQGQHIFNEIIVTGNRVVTCGTFIEEIYIKAKFRRLKLW